MSMLRVGCYSVTFSQVYCPPGNAGHRSFVGTLRVVEDDGDQFRVSGDLYQTGEVLPLSGGEFDDPEELEALLVETAAPDNGVPVFPLHAYDSHLRVIGAEAGADEGWITLWCERYRYFGDSRSAEYVGSFIMRLRRQAGVGEYPDPSEHWVGPVEDAAGQLVGMISLGWVSPHIRKATLEIDFEDGAVLAMDNGRGLGWKCVFGELRWDLEVILGEAIPLPDSGSWTGDSLHEAMLAFRDHDDLDSQWRYHLFCVRRLEFGDGVGAAMYDRGNFDANQIPREGFAVSSEFVLPNTPEYGRAAGCAAGEVPEAYFRTAVHELGHALGLSHGRGPYFMNTTNSVARLGTDGAPFPENIVFAFSPVDRIRLQHAPDILLRPGGPFRAGEFRYALDPPPPLLLRWNRRQVEHS